MNRFSTHFSLANTLLFAASNVVFYALLIRHVSPEMMREWVLFMVLVSFVEMARQGIVNNGMMRMLARGDEKSEGSILGAGLLLAVLSSFLGVFAAYFASFFLSNWWQTPHLASLCLSYLPLSLLWAVFKWAEGFLAVRGRFEGVFFATFTYTAALLGSFLYFSTHTKLDLHQIIHLQSVALFLALALLFFVKKWRVWPQQPEKKDIKELVEYGRFSMGTSFLSMLFNKMDILLIGVLLPGASVVLYDAATRIFSWLDLPMNGLASVLYPRLCCAQAESGSLGMQAVSEKGLIQLFSITAPAVLLVLVGAPLILEILAGSAYTEASGILRILILATLIKPWGRLSGMALDALGLPKANFLLLVFSVGSNFVLNLLFIHLLGVLGAAIATTLSIWFTVFLGQKWVSRHFSLNHFAVLRQIPAQFLAYSEPMRRWFVG